MVVLRSVPDLAEGSGREPLHRLAAQAAWPRAPARRGCRSCAARPTGLPAHLRARPDAVRMPAGARTRFSGRHARTGRRCQRTTVQKAYIASTLAVESSVPRFYLARTGDVPGRRLRGTSTRGPGARSRAARGAVTVAGGDQRGARETAPTPAAVASAALPAGTHAGGGRAARRAAGSISDAPRDPGRG